MFFLIRRLFGPLLEVIFNHTTRPARQATLLWTLATAVDRHITLIPFLEGLAEEARGHWRHQLRGLADLLQSGASIPDALESVADILPEETLVMIRVGAESGQLGQALRDAATQASRRANSPSQPLPLGLEYLFVVGLVMLAVLTFTMYFIIPKFKAIFDGFNIELPEITLALIRSADFAVEYFYLVIPAIMALLLAMGTAGFELTGLLSGSSTTPRFLFRWLPRLRMPTLLRCLSLSVDGARSLHDTLILLLTRHPNPAMRVRLAAVEESVAQGQACWESFHAAGLLRRRDVNLLESAERVGNLSWALRGVADSMERRTEQRARLIAECVRPLGMLVVGTIVGFFVIGMFIPVVKVILELPIEGVST